MKALTVQQPYGWAFGHGKDTENRSGRFPRPLGTAVAIHTARRWSTAGGHDPAVVEAFVRSRNDATGMPEARLRAVINRVAAEGLPRDWTGFVYSSLVAVADLVDAHPDDGSCCRPWGMSTLPGGRTQGPLRHLKFDRLRPLPRPIPCRGALGLWDVPADLMPQLLEGLAAAERSVHDAEAAVRRAFTPLSTV